MSLITKSAMKLLLTTEVVEMDKILRDPNLLATCRRLSYGGSSGMNMALDYYQGLILSRSVDAKGIFGIYQKQFVGWALFTREDDRFYFRAEPGKACFQVFVDPQYRRNGVGSKLLQIAKELVAPNETIAAYMHSAPSFFGAPANQGTVQPVT